MMKNSLKDLCVNLIRAGRTEGLMEQLDVFLLCKRLTTQEYEELAEMLGVKPAEEPAK